MNRPQHMESALERFHDAPRVLSRLGHFLTDQVHHEPLTISDHFSRRTTLHSIQPAAGVGYTEQLVAVPDYLALDRMRQIAQKHGSEAGIQQILDLQTPRSRAPLPQIPLDGNGRRI